MAFRVQRAVNVYVGESTDIKPMPGGVVDGVTIGEDEIPVGSRFKETDTGHEYEFDGEAWTFTAPDKTEAQILEGIHEELVRIRTGMEAQLYNGNEYGQG